MEINEIKTKKKVGKNVLIKKYTIILSSLFIILSISIFLYLLYQNDETWVRYKSYNIGSMTQEQKEQYARDYMLDKYGIETKTEYVIPEGTAFSRLYPFVKITPKNSNDQCEYYHVFFKPNGKICDDYYLHDIQDFITEKVTQDTEELPYDCVVFTHTYTLSPYFPTYKMKRLAKDDPIEFIKLKKTITRIDYIFSNNCVEHKDELCKILEEKTSSYIFADGNLFFVDGDIHEFDFSSLEPEMLLSTYRNY